jgi:hypothetical protein
MYIMAAWTGHGVMPLAAVSIQDLSADPLKHALVQLLVIRAGKPVWNIIRRAETGPDHARAM